MVQTDISSIVYVGNASTTALYPVPFNFFRDEDLIVVVKDATGAEDTQILNTDYTVTGEGDPNGGAVTFTWAVPATSFVTILRDIDATQLTSYEEADAFPAKSHERALDKLTMLVQQALRVTGTGNPADLGRAFRLTGASVGINAVAKLNDTTLGLNAAGNAVLRTASEMLSWLGQVGTVWQNTAERLLTRGAYAGQVGVQLDNYTIYIAQSDTPGDWIPFLLGSGIIGATNGVPYLLTPPAGDLVGTEQSQTLYNKTLESSTIHTPTGLTKNDVGLSQVDNTSDLNKPLSSATGAALAFKQDKSEKAISNGYPSLDGGGKIPLAQIPDAVIGASQYQGTWNAATNTPTIPTAVVGNKGWYYAVSVAGTTNINGINSWAVGDQIISNGTVWQKIVNVSAVSSVNSKTGAVVLVPADLNLGNVDNTSDATKNAAAVTLTNKTINGAANTLIVRLDADVTNNLPVARLNNGTGAAGTTWWCGDGSWKQPPGTGDVNGPNGSTDGELCLYSGTTGKVIRRFSGTAGFAKANTTGILTTQAQMGAADLAPTVISGQTVKNWPNINDTVLILDSTTGQLRSMLADHAAYGVPRNYLTGCTLANNVADTANDIDVTAGACRDTTDSYNIYVLALTKRLDALWVEGSGQGGRDTGVIGDGGWFVFAIYNPTTRVSDVLFSQNLPSPILPSGFTAKRRIGWFYRDVTNFGGIKAFRQFGDYFQWISPYMEVSDAQQVQGQSGLFSFQVPGGMKMQMHVTLRTYASAGSCLYTVKDPDTFPAANIASTTANVQTVYITVLWTNASAQLAFNIGQATGTVHMLFQSLGYWDPRGQDGTYLF